MDLGPFEGIEYREINGCDDCPMRFMSYCLAVSKEDSCIIKPFNDLTPDFCPLRKQPIMIELKEKNA